MVVVTLKSLEREDLASILRLLDHSIFGELMSRVNLIKHELNDARLEDIAMVLIDLKKWLNDLLSKVSDLTAKDLLAHFKEIGSADDRLLNHLIILLKLGLHLALDLSQALHQLLFTHSLDNS